MSIVARKMAQIPFAGIRKVFERAAELEKRGRRIIHFEIGRPDFDTPPHIKEAALRALNRGMVHYTPNAGIPELCEAIADHLLHYKSVHLDPRSEVMVTAGGQEAMYLSLQALLDPGVEVFVPDPGYGQFYSCVRLSGGTPVPFPLLEKENFRPDLEAARSLLTRRTRGIIINSPHNPTGVVLSSEQIQALCRFALENDLIVFSDEAYDHILYDGVPFVSPASLPGMKERTIIWGSFSKTYAMTGWRVGYLAAPAEVIAASVKIQQNLMLSTCSFAQAGAVAALKGPQDCVTEMVREFDERRMVIMRGVNEVPGLSCPASPQGAFYVFLKFQTDMDSGELAEYLLEEAGVAAVPGRSFGTGGEGYLRISYATSQPDCREGMNRLAKAMAALAIK